MGFGWGLDWGVWMGVWLDVGVGDWMLDIGIDSA